MIFLSTTIKKKIDSQKESNLWTGRQVLKVSRIGSDWENYKMIINYEEKIQNLCWADIYRRQQTLVVCQSSSHSLGVVTIINI